MIQTKAVQQSEHAEFEEDIKETQDVMKLLGVAIQILNESREAAGESSLGNAISLLQTLHTNTASEEETLVGPKTLQKQKGSAKRAIGGKGQCKAQPMTGRPPLKKAAVQDFVQTLRRLQHPGVGPVHLVLWGTVSQSFHLAGTERRGSPL